MRNTELKHLPNLHENLGKILEVASDCDKIELVKIHLDEMSQKIQNNRHLKDLDKSHTEEIWIAIRYIDSLIENGKFCKSEVVGVLTDYISLKIKDLDAMISTESN